MEARSSGKGIVPGADGRLWGLRWGLEVDPKGAMKLSGRSRPTSQQVVFGEWRFIDRLGEDLMRKQVY